MNKIISALLVLLFTVNAHASLGGIPFEILHKGTGIRILGMGEAGTANCEDATAVFWNPAYLDSVTQNHIYASIETFFEGANYDYMSYVGPVGNYGGFGLSAAVMNYGSYDRVDENGISLGGEGYMRDIFVTGAYGKGVVAGIQAGFSAKLLIRYVGDESVVAFNADVAFYKAFGEIFDMGIVFKNVLPLSVAYSVSEEKFVHSVKAGICLKFLDQTLRIAVDGEKYFIPSDPLVFAGIEYKVFELVSLRGGYNTAGDISTGIGVEKDGISVDYALIFNDLAMSHKFAIGYRFGGYDMALIAEPDVISPSGGNRKSYIRVKSKTKYEIFKWKIEILNSSNEIVQEWHGAGEPDDSVVWDGLTESGMPLKDGEYRAYITVVDENDVPIKSEATVIKIKSSDSYNMPLFGD